MRPTKSNKPIPQMRLFRGTDATWNHFGSLSPFGSNMTEARRTGAVITDEKTQKKIECPPGGGLNPCCRTVSDRKLWNGTNKIRKSSLAFIADGRAQRPATVAGDALRRR
jgi:hypothetical protein